MRFEEGKDGQERRASASQTERPKRQAMRGAARSIGGRDTNAVVEDVLNSPRPCKDWTPGKVELKLDHDPADG